MHCQNNRYILNIKQRSAMIELINRDYADFVNLSGNLVGLDKAISNLEEPLSVIHSEISVKIIIFEIVNYYFLFYSAE